MLDAVNLLGGDRLRAWDAATTIHEPHRLGRTKAKMGDWISEVLLFSAGIAGGVLSMILIPGVHANRRRRTELVAARSRILADMKEKHEEEMLAQALRTTEAIRGELNHSLQTLRKTVTTVLAPVGNENNGRRKPPAHRSQSTERNP